MKTKTLIVVSFLFLQNCQPADPTNNVNKVTLDAADVASDIGDDFEGADSTSFEPLISRNMPEKCDNARPAQTSNLERTGCKSDDDCNFGDNGRCVFKFGIDIGMHDCTYDECFKDDDCGENEACSCGEDQHSNEIFGLRSDENKCVASNCLTDGDCGDHFCKPNPTMCSEGGTRVIGYYCTTEQDDCRVDSDCEDSVCVFSQTEKNWFVLRDVHRQNRFQTKISPVTSVDRRWV